MSDNTFRVVVVGGGILGTMHAVEAARRGFSVVQLERDALPSGASVRNFGLIWVGGRAPGRELELALEARERWEAVAAAAPGTGFRANGSLTVARSRDELAVLEEAAAAPDAAERGFSLLGPEAAKEHSPALSGPLLGALFCERDAIVEPRLTLGALRAHLERVGAYRYLPGRTVVDFDAQVVVDQTGERHEADLIVCCPGAEPGGALGWALRDAPLRKVQLQMLETAPYGTPLSSALADGDSLRYYPAYDGPARRALAPQEPIAARWNAQLLLVARLSGHLTIGDTHRYEEPFAFDIADEPSIHLLGVAEALLGPLPPVERRWQGIYVEVTRPELVYYRAELAPGVIVVTGAGGRGMTMSPAIAGESFE